MSIQTRLVSGLIALLLLAACVAPPPVAVNQTLETSAASSTPASEPVTLNMRLFSDPPSIDPALAPDQISTTIVEQTFMGLTSYADDALAVVPELATDWSVSEDGRTWTFHLRDDIPWVRWDPESGEVFQEVDESGNVRIVNAHDVVYGVQRTLNPTTGSGYAYVLYSIANAAAVNTAEEVTLELLDSLGVRAVDDFTVEFTLENPAAYFPGIAGLWVARPMPSWAIEEGGEQWTDPGSLVSNGPFTLAEWLHEDSLTLVRNPYWPLWNEPESGNIDRIEFVIIPEQSTALALYETNELDTTPVPAPDFERVKGDDTLGNELQVLPELSTTYIGFTQSKPPLDNPLVRKALAAAIDRQAIVDSLENGLPIVANAFAPKGVFGNAAGDPAIGGWMLGYDKGRELAKEWMAEAGYPEGEGINLTIMHWGSESSDRWMQAIQSMWADVFPKANFGLETMEFGAFLNSLYPNSPVEQAPDVWLMGWAADYPDQNNWLHEVLHAEEGLNFSRAEPTEFEQLTKEAQVETDPKRREDLYREAERMLIEDEVRISPLFYTAYARLDKPWLTRTNSLLATVQMDRWSVDWEAKQAALGQ
ncbi:MAG: peptide ABC transporter substrate-binding protein [Caldilineaceae bacterium]|nr:peptide ABC transporter substrate-binding protein [Caldilineaceae bacterium]